MNRPNLRRWLVAVLLCGALPRAAAAQQPDDVQRARESFKAGATAYAAGEYVAAIQALGAAYTLTPAPAIAFSLAQAERKQYFVAHEREHLDRAIALFRRYLVQVPSGGRRADALDALSQLEPLAATQASADPSRPPGEVDAIQRTRVMITSETPEARVSLDGSTAVLSPLIREVEPGKHHVEVSAKGFFPAARELVAVAGELVPADVPLRERPSTVVLSTPRDAEIYVDGTFASQGGEGVSLQLTSGAHRLAVADTGHRVSARVLELERGETQTLRILLEPTRQRTASVVLFLGGAAAVGAGAVFSGLSLHAEGRAHDFLDRQSRGNVSSDDLLGYQTAVADRDRFRTAATLSFAASGGLLITGLFLYELDRPNPQELRRAERLPEPERPGPPRGTNPSSLRVMPVVAPGHFGATLRATF